jgi:integrase
MLGHGVPIVTVSQRLGHARASTTLNVYGHSIPGADRDAARLISNLATASSSGIDRRPSALAERA